MDLRGLFAFAGPSCRILRTPLLILNAADDPLVAFDSHPDPATLPAQVRLEVAPCGGHLGFLGRKAGHWHPWAPAA